MAILSKKQASEIAQLPKEIDSLVRKAFTEQFMSGKFEDLFKETKSEVLELIKTSDEVTLNKSTALKTQYGSVNLIEIKTKKVDKDKLFEHLETLPKDKILALLTNAVSTFNNENLEKELSREVFEKVVTIGAYDQFKFTSNSDFKAQCESEFSGEAKPVKVEAKKPVAAKPEVKVKSSDAVTRAKEAALKAKALSKPKKTAKPADDDLDAILGGD